jgi:hypothetical protein
MLPGPASISCDGRRSAKQVEAAKIVGRGPTPPRLFFLFADSAVPSFLKIRTTRFWNPGLLLLVSEDLTRWRLCRRRGNCVSAYKTTLPSVASLLKPRLRRWKSGSR